MREYDVRKIAVMTCAAVLAAFSLTACGSRKTEEAGCNNLRGSSGIVFTDCVRQQENGRDDPGRSH